MFFSSGSVIKVSRDISEKRVVDLSLEFDKKYGAASGSDVLAGYFLL